MSGQLGHGTTELQALQALGKKIGATSIDDVLRYLSGKTTMGQTIPMLGQNLNFLTAGKLSKPIGRFAGSAMGRGIARTIPGISAAVNVLDVADILAGDDSLGNKVMDTAAMGIGGTIGGVLGGGVFSPLTASIGASTGKAISDGVQGLFGGGKSAEERKLEEALALLQGGRI